MMSSCYSAYSATPGKVMPLDPIGRKTFQLQQVGVRRTRKLRLADSFRQSCCHNLAAATGAYSATPGKILRTLDPILQKDLCSRQQVGVRRSNNIEISRRFRQSTCAQAVGSATPPTVPFLVQSDAPRSYRQTDISGYSVRNLTPKSGGWSCSLLCPLPRRKSATISGWKLEKWKTSKVLGEDDACKVFFCADDSLRFFCCKARIWRRSCKLHGFGIASLGNMKNGMQIICRESCLAFLLEPAWPISHPTQQPHFLYTNASGHGKKASGIITMVTCAVVTRETAAATKSTHIAHVFTCPRMNAHQGSRSFHI